MQDTNEQLQKVTQGLVQACEDMNATCRKSMEAAIESVSAFSKGWEEFGRNLGSLMQESMARSVSAGKTIMEAKSPKEAADLHAEFIKNCFDSWTAGAGRLSEISARTTQEAFEPVAKHASAAIGQATQRAQGRAA